MKKDGFTLVELVVVIVILGMLMAFAVPRILNSQTASKKAITDQEKSAIVEAGQMVGIDLTDYMSEIYNCKSGSWIATGNRCKPLNASGKWVEVKISVKDLVDHDYLTDTANHCSGDITITNNGGVYKVNADNVTCTQ